MPMPVKIAPLSARKPFTSFLLRCAAAAKFSAHVFVASAAPLNTVSNFEFVSSALAAASMAAPQNSLIASTPFLMMARPAAAAATMFRTPTRFSPAPAPFLPISSSLRPVSSAWAPRPLASSSALFRALPSVALMVWIGCLKAFPMSVATLLVAAPMPLNFAWTLETAAPRPVRSVFARLSPCLMLSSMALRTLVPIFAPAPDTLLKAAVARVPTSVRLVPICSSLSAVCSASSCAFRCFSFNSSRGAVSVPNCTPKDRLRLSAITPLLFFLLLFFQLLDKHLLGGDALVILGHVHGFQIRVRQAVAVKKHKPELLISYRSPLRRFRTSFPVEESARSRGSAAPAFRCPRFPRTLSGPCLPHWPGL